MRIVEPSHEFITPLNRDAILKRLEECGRTCYRSEGKATEDSAPKFVSMIVKLAHDSVLEHCSLTVRFVTDNGILRELTRHRIGVSFTVESTRYCSCNKDQFGNELSVVKPSGIKEARDGAWLNYGTWLAACEQAEGAYFKLLESGVKPEIARSVLPLCTATTLVMSANLRAWRHVLQLRCAPSAHPDMRALTMPLLKDFNDALPEVFEDIADAVFAKDARNAAVS